MMRLITLHIPARFWQRRAGAQRLLAPGFGTGGAMLMRQRAAEAANRGAPLTLRR
jgi:hypothetical protein